MTVCVTRREISQLGRSTVQGYVECNTMPWYLKPRVDGL